MTVHIVTDSTADLQPEEAKTLGITVVPLTVFFGEEAYLDTVEIDDASFYSKLQTSKELPRTSQPSLGSFQTTFTRLIEEGTDGIISVHLSSKLSGTYQSACTACDTLPESLRKVPIEIIDSRSISAGMALALKRAAAEARQNLSLEEIKAHLMDQFVRTRIIAVLDTLEFVKRGGRIGSAEALLGNMLSFKPIISLKDGEVVPLERPRTRGKAYARVAQIIAESGPLQELAIAGTSEEVGLQLAEALRSVYQGEISHYKLGSVLGTHTGPDTVAAVTVSARH
ncbi:MAG TPA: DegV family protein [Ktedonobacteraceae bacterium]|nr:DegV family protein [Ktedonobacteraceae bacterium]